MSLIVENLPEYLKLIAEVIGVIAIIATVVVRFTPSKTDDEDASRIIDKLFKAINYLPTIGINPRTKKLEEAVKELRESK